MKFRAQNEEKKKKDKKTKYKYEFKKIKNPLQWLIYITN